MGKLFFTAGFSALLFFSCIPESGKNGTDSTLKVVDSSHTVSFNNYVDTMPKQVNDTFLEGTHIEKWPNGTIYMRGDVKGGYRHGEWLTFYQDGKLWSQGTYINGYREGYGIAYYPNGNKHEEGYYKKGKKVGMWKYWNEQGVEVNYNFGGDTTGVKK